MQNSPQSGLCGKKIHWVKSVLTVWLPVAGFTVLTVLVIVNRRGHDQDSGRGEEAHLAGRIESEAVSTATEFRVIDGDSLNITFGVDIPVSIRLAEIDAPELGQHFGFEAKENLERQLAKHPPELTFEENGKYGRKICTILVDGRNLNLELVEEGFAWASPDAGASFHNAQKLAQERGVGLWNRSDPTSPWDWRAAK